MLTAKQRELLLFIDDRLKDSGISPSFDEMREALELKSKSGVHRLISALEERGFIRRLPNRARALEVLKLPEARPSASVTPIRPWRGRSTTSLAGCGVRTGAAPSLTGTPFTLASGMRRTSRARARFGRRRMKPRSSSAEISR